MSTDHDTPTDRQERGGGDAGSDAGERAQGAVRDAAGSTSGQGLARAGLAARGFVYLLVGYLAFRIAAGATGGRGGGTNHSASGTGAVHALADGPGGQAVLVALAVGLVGYSAFSGIDAVLHHDDEDNAARRWGDRLLSLWGSLLYLVFAGFTVRVLLSPHSGKSSAGKSSQRKTSLTAHVLGWPAGRWLVGLVALVVAIAALGLLRRGLTRGFRERFDPEQVPRPAWIAIQVLATPGVLARSVAYGVVSTLVFIAAARNEPKKAKGLDGALRDLAHHGWGPFLLYPIATGLVMFAVYLGFEARYRRGGPHAGGASGSASDSEHADR